MLRLALCGRRLAGLKGVARAACGGAVRGHLYYDRGGERCLEHRYRVPPDSRPAHFFSTSSNPSIPNEDTLVYTGNLTKTVLGVKFFSYSTSMVTLALLPYVMSKSGLSVDSVVLKAAFYSVVGFFTFVSPVTLHLISKGYVSRLYHNKDKDLYTAITHNAFFAEKRSVFSPADVEVPGISKMFTTFYVKKKSMLVNPDLFPNAWDYHHLMGYDKPFSFEPKDPNEPSKDQ